MEHLIELNKIGKGSRRIVMKYRKKPVAIEAIQWDGNFNRSSMFY